MKSIFLPLFVGFFSEAFSQQQLGNVYAGNINQPAQIIQTNVLGNAGNLNVETNFNSNKSNDNNPIQLQVNYIDNNVGNEQQMQQSINNPKQTNDDVNNGKGIDLSLNFSSRSSSSSSSSGMSSKKVNRKSFHKKLNKFNRNFYGKLASHKKSKHLVDVCFNWSK